MWVHLCLMKKNSSKKNPKYYLSKKSKEGNTKNREDLKELLLLKHINTSCLTFSEGSFILEAGKSVDSNSKTSYNSLLKTITSIIWRVFSWKGMHKLISIGKYSWQRKLNISKKERKDGKNWKPCIDSKEWPLFTNHKIEILINKKIIMKDNAAAITNIKSRKLSARG